MALQKWGRDTNYPVTRNYYSVLFTASSLPLITFTAQYIHRVEMLILETPSN